MNKTIYDAAIRCRDYADNNIQTRMTMYRGDGTERTEVLGDIKGYERCLCELREVIKDTYPLIERQLARLMAQYDSHPYSYMRLLESLVETIISLELQARIDYKKDNISPQGATETDNFPKIFISHSSDDRKVVDAFVKEILLLGCKFRECDIFCTLDSTAIKTGEIFRDKIIDNMNKLDYILLFISANYKSSEVCMNEMGAAWAFKEKRVLPLVFPGIKFSQMGFLNVVKQGAMLTDRAKLDELYAELCTKYNMAEDWRSFNKYKDDFIEVVTLNANDSE